jgi:hypothetical protein
MLALYGAPAREANLAICARASIRNPFPRLGEKTARHLQSFGRDTPETVGYSFHMNLRHVLLGGTAARTKSPVRRLPFCICPPFFSD